MVRQGWTKEEKGVCPGWRQGRKYYEKEKE
jgi:hypothetical protein